MKPRDSVPLGLMQNSNNRLFLDYVDLFDLQPCAGDEIYAEDFFSEMLWSYRVIIAQDKASWKDFCRSSPDSPMHQHPDGRESRSFQKCTDPLLNRLETHGWRRSTSSTMSSMLKDLSA